MIWSAAEQQAMRNIYTSVWLTFHMLPPTPRVLTPHSAHRSRALGIRYRKPTIRSWLGNCRFTGTNDYSPKGTIMKKLALSALLALALTSPLAACTAGAETAGPPAVTSSPTASCTEDMDCWDCETMGNKVCGTIDDAATAWEVFDREDGAKKLKVDGTRPFKVEYMASSDSTPENMDTYDLALVGTDGRWYVFRATYTD